MKDKATKQFKEAAKEKTGMFQSRFYELTAELPAKRVGTMDGTTGSRTEFIAAWWKSGSLAALSWWLIVAGGQCSPVS